MSNNNSNILSNDLPENQKGLLQLSNELEDDLDNEKDKEAEFEVMAKEGLATINEEKAARIIEELNVGLQKSLKKKRERKNRIADQKVFYITIITLLIMVIAAFFVIKKLIA